MFQVEAEKRHRESSKKSKERTVDPPKEGKRLPSRVVLRIQEVLAVGRAE